MRLKYLAFAATALAFAGMVACAGSPTAPTSTGASTAQSADLAGANLAAPTSRGSIALQDASSHPSISVSTRSARSVGMDRNTLEIRLPADWDAQNVQLERVHRYDVTNMWVPVSPPIVARSAPHAANGSAVDISVQHEAFDSGGRFEGWLQRNIGGRSEDVHISWEFAEP
jgi:hypothetical protein